MLYFPVPVMAAMELRDKNITNFPILAQSLLFLHNGGASLLSLLI